MLPTSLLRQSSARWLTAPLLFLCLSFPVCAGEKYALLIGVNEYKSKDLKTLRYAENDVTELARTLIERCGFSKDKVLLMTLSNPGKDRQWIPEGKKILVELEAIIKKCKQEDMLIIGLAGHGVQLKGDKESYFCPTDADLTNPKTLIPLESKVYKLLEDKCKANAKLLIVDACRNDPRKQARNFKNLNLQKLNNPQVLKLPKGVAALFSCSAGQEAWVDADLKHGVFFHFLIRGLQGEAANRRGRVSLPLLKDYVQTEVTSYVKEKLREKQSPDLISGPGVGVITLAEEPELKFRWSALKGPGKPFYQKEIITVYTKMTYQGRIIQNSTTSQTVVYKWTPMEMKKGRYRAQFQLLDLMLDVDLQKKALPREWHDLLTLTQDKGVVLVFDPATMRVVEIEGQAELWDSIKTRAEQRKIVITNQLKALYDGLFSATALKGHDLGLPFLPVTGRDSIKKGWARTGSYNGVTGIYTMNHRCALKNAEHWERINLELETAMQPSNRTQGQKADSHKGEIVYNLKTGRIEKFTTKKEEEGTVRRRFNIRGSNRSVMLSCQILHRESQTWTISDRNPMKQKVIAAKPKVGEGGNAVVKP